MDIPIELFLGFTGISIVLAIFGFLRNPQIPATIVMGGMFILFLSVATDNVIMGSNINTINIENTNGTEIVREYIYNVNFTQDVQLSTTAITSSEFASNTSSLIGNSFQCMEILVARTPTLPDNPLYFGIMNTTGHLTFNFTSFQPSDIMTDAENYESCLPDNTFYTIQAQDRIGAKSIIMAGSRSYIMYQDNNNPFDGTNSYRQGFNPVTMTWSGATSNDMTMKLYNNTIVEIPLETTSYTYEDNLYEFTELPKTLFALIGVMIMLVGGLMVMRD